LSGQVTYTVNTMSPVTLPGTTLVALVVPPKPTGFA